MKPIRKVLLGVALFFFIILGVGWILPSSFHVERQILINAQPDAIFTHIGDLHNWQKWGVWFERDPQMEVTFSGTAGTVGMTSSWISESQGSGEMEIIAIEPNKMMSYRLFFPEFGMGSTGKILLQSQGDKTLVIWQDFGDVGSNPINHYFAALMDTMIGPDFEQGLENLKTLTESEKR